MHKKNASGWTSFRTLPRICAYFFHTYLRQHKSGEVYEEPLKSSMARAYFDYHRETLRRWDPETRLLVVKENSIIAISTHGICKSVT